jgi:NAD(P)-dependent dehydrogenase (short-subunit alcohol dehydrogenase family)
LAQAGHAADRVTLVTGAAYGIGRAISARLIAQGERVIMIDIDPAVQAAAAELGAQATAWLADLSDPSAISGLFERIRTQCGRLDGLVNNAAWQKESAGVADQPLEEWEQVMAVCLRAPYLAIKHALPIMIAQGGGAIVNLSSIHAVRSYRGHPAYGTAKSGLLALTRQVAYEYGPQGIRVNAVLPGLIEDARHPLNRERRAKAYPVRRIGTPEDVAALVAFLLGPESSFISGADILIDGGLAAYSPEEMLP